LRRLSRAGATSVRRRKSRVGVKAMRSPSCAPRRLVRSSVRPVASVSSRSARSCSPSTPRSSRPWPMPEGSLAGCYRDHGKRLRGAGGAAVGPRSAAGGAGRGPRQSASRARYASHQSALKHQSLLTQRETIRGAIERAREQLTTLTERRGRLEQAQGDNDAPVENLRGELDAASC
jgi:hypothetical protein